MRKEFVIIALIIFIMVFAGAFLHKGESDDVSIVALNAPPRLGLNTIGQLEIVLQNNETYPVNINLDVENAFVDENGISLSRIIKSGKYDLGQYISDHDWFPREIMLSPGENKIREYIGYEATGTYDVKVKLYQNEQVVDEKTHSIQIMPPVLSLKLDYTENYSDELLIYMIEGYILNEGLGRAGDIDTTVTIANLESGEILSSENYQYEVSGNTKTKLSEWRDLPIAVIELSPEGDSNESYRPLESVAKGKIGERYILTVELNWKDQNDSSELILPDSNEQMGAY
jgi:hypothetical protein